MTKKRSMTVLVVVLAAAVVLTGGLMASNMGFKLNRALKSAADPGSASGTQLLGLPYNRQVGIDTAEALFKDISSAGSIQNIQRYDTTNDTYVPYTFGLADFPLVAGQGVGRVARDPLRTGGERRGAGHASTLPGADWRGQGRMGRPAS